METAQQGTVSDNTYLRRKTITQPGQHRVNGQIRAAKLRVIGEDGSQLGILDLRAALKAAEDAGLDLVEVSPNSDPPVAKIADAGKLAYEASLKAREARKHQVKTLVKEIKFRPSIDAHDYETKKRHVLRFLEDGDRVKVTVMFRGREQSRPEMGKRILDQLAEDVNETANVEGTPKLEGRNMLMLLVPKK